MTEPTNEQVERVARAMFSVKYKDLPWPKHPGNAELADLYLQQARAAIAAMPGWQPLKTMPLNTPMLILLSEATPQHVGRGSAPLCRVMVGDMQERDRPFMTGPNGETVLATHWQPLPSPPEN